MDNFKTRDRQFLEQMEEQFLAPFAAKSAIGAQTRLIEEEEHPYRTAFQRDRDRIIHSRAFRRLKHKRQVFLVTYGDHYRTRITHTIEVSQLSRTLSRALGLNEDLAEAIALGHDLGHTPFGHIGEVVLHRIMKGHDDMDGTLDIEDAGGFKHNYQSVRIVDFNEMKYDFRGLNVTASVREGILKHTRLRRNDIDFPEFEMRGLHYDLDHATTLEGQVVAVCDEIAQRTHDLEDGLRAKHVSLDDIRSLEIIKLVEKRYGLHSSLKADPFLYRNRLIRKLVNFLVTDVIDTSMQNIKAYIDETNKTTFFDRQLVWFSEPVHPMQNELDKFIMRRIISIAAEKRRDSQAEQTIRNLFKSYYLNPNLLPPFQLQKCFSNDDIEIIYSGQGKKNSHFKKNKQFVRAVCDHVAGMSDQHAQQTDENLKKKSSAELRSFRSDRDDGLY
jgi:dGTPase